MSKPPEPRPRSSACTLTTSSSPTSARPTSAMSAIAVRRLCSPRASAPFSWAPPFASCASSTSSITRSCSPALPGNRRRGRWHGAASASGWDAIARRCVRWPAARRRSAPAGIRGCLRPYPLDAHVHDRTRTRASWPARARDRSASPQQPVPVTRRRHGRRSPRAADAPWRMPRCAAVARSRDPRSRSARRASPRPRRSYRPRHCGCALPRRAYRPAPGQRR